jgi:hypothetical protein
MPLCVFSASVDKMDNSIFYFLVLSEKTAFFRLNDLFPECSLYREPSPQIEPLVCLAEDASCLVGRNCMEHLVKRIKVLFEEIVPTANLMVVYFRKRNKPGLGAGIFWRDFREPRVITMNPRAWERIKLRGGAFQFMPSREFFLTGNAEKSSEIDDKQVLSL